MRTWTLGDATKRALANAGITGGIVALSTMQLGLGFVDGIVAGGITALTIMGKELGIDGYREAGQWQMVEPVIGEEI